ncbi:protein N-lysine methyltransferase METTL21A isoform X1 [Asparagus officinalis]|uniref:protein N-lysine methyltransferase METTL21A isoform X1 n=1 Tax=Asparagus officinalis TaxID=4686 RepID=UPI00098E64E2|nr:protein N-lysine methyltransferase METTL21A isoform X1 [Asparagus officinalis]
MERNRRKGRFCASKLKGKRAIELGAGCGLAGLGMALLGCNVVSTDQIEVLPLLIRNVERNTSRIAQANTDSELFGSIKVEELDWGNKDHIKALDPPFDYIIGTDVVYAEHLLEPLLQTILGLAGPRTTILLGYEIRSNTVHARMMQMWKNNFDVKTVPITKMDVKYRHPSIQLYIMTPKAQTKCDELKVPGSDQVDSEVVESNETEEKEEACNEKSVDGEIPEIGSDKVDDWETRRCGAMAARLLKDVKIA